MRHLVYRLKLDPNSNVFVVSHKSLYDEGCVQFFGWLSTGILDGISHTSSATPVWASDKEKPTRPFPRCLDSLELWDVHMGDEGFQALIDWLKALHEPLVHLTKLSLRAVRALSLNFMSDTYYMLQNYIRGDAQLATDFVSASPQLSSLVLSSNPLSPEFKRTLFSLLPELPCLAALHLSMTGLDSTDARALAAYITRGCKLVELHASSNNMGYKGVRALARAVQHCWTMEKMDVYGNDIEADEQDDSESDDEWGGWQTLRDDVKNIVARNVFLKSQTAREALTLLKYSRLMLQPLPSPETASSCTDCDCVPVTPQNTQSPPSTSPLHALPVEIQLAILSQLAPTLSTQQRLRVFAFATDMRTLPSLRLCLPASKSSATQCLPDPGSLAFPSQMTGKRFGSLRRDTTNTNVHTCGDGNCMGNKSVLCKRKTDRQKWLGQIGCDSYDPS